MHQYFQIDIFPVSIVCRMIWKSGQVSFWKDKVQDRCSFAEFLHNCLSHGDNTENLEIWRSWNLEESVLKWTKGKIRSVVLKFYKISGGWYITISIGLDPFSVVWQPSNTSSWNSQWSYLWWTCLSSWSCSPYLRYKCSGINTHSFLIHIKFNLSQPESSPLPPPRTTIIIVMLMSRCKRPLDLKALVETL